MVGKLPWDHLYELGDPNRIAIKQSLDGTPSSITAFIKECRKFEPMDIYSYPDYKQLLSILGGNPNHIRTPYIYPHTTYVNYKSLLELKLFDGIKGNSDNIMTFIEHNLETVHDLHRRFETQNIKDRNSLQQYLESIGIPVNDASRFIKFSRLWGPYFIL